MTAIRSEDSTPTPRVSRTEIAAKALSFHGFALAVVWPALGARAGGSSASGLAIAATVLTAFTPWGIWATPPKFAAAWVRRPEFAFGLVPLAWLVAMAALELVGTTFATSYVVLAAVGVAAHVGAAIQLDRIAPPPPGLTVDRSGRDGLAPTRRRARLRTMLVVTVSIVFVGFILFVSTVTADVAPLERAFAAVMVSVLGASVLLLLVSRGMRRVRRTPHEQSTWARTVLVASLGVATALGLEYFTR